MREAASHTRKDTHEVDAAYLRICYDAAGLAAAYYGWTRIDCVDWSGALRTPEDIHRDILSLI